MKRKIDKVLLEWMSRQERKPLILRGARQVGKTFSVSEFGHNEFENFIHIDFELDRGFRKIFDGELSPPNILLQIEAYTAKTCIPGKTLLFLDEIQLCPRAMMSLRYFYEKMPELHVIAAGSMLEFALERSSFPVGRVEFAWLRPICFEEFLWALGFEKLASQMPDIDSRIPLSDALYAKLMENLKLYFLVGGMPEAVKSFVSTKSFSPVSEIHRSLCQAYFQDFAKYGSRIDRDCLEHVFEQIPQSVGNNIKYTSLYPEKRIEKIKEALLTLEKALIIQKIRSTPANGLPLGADSSSKTFKVLFLDIGLMQHLCGVVPRDVIEGKDLLDVYRGALAEQFIGQELLVHAGGSENGKMYYWSRAQKNSAAEVDYLLVRNGEIIPVEVKSGSLGRLKSLQVFMGDHT
jgi:predicted AAA+ superfamily ATPase